MGLKVRTVIKTHKIPQFIHGCNILKGSNLPVLFLYLFVFGRYIGLHYYNVAYKNAFKGNRNA